MREIDNQRLRLQAASPKGSGQVKKDLKGKGFKQ